MSVGLCLQSTPVRQSYLAKHAKPPKYSPSPLRPDISTPDCLVHWLTPFSISYMNDRSACFPPEVIVCEHFVISHAVSNNTLSNYTAGLLHFTNFCDNFNIPENNRMPATKSLLCIFITTHGAGKVGKGTLLLWLFRLELWHTINSAHKWFMAHCNEAWTASFPNKLTSHSFRIGGTTHLLLLGLNPFIVMVQGCWKSDAFLSYWKHCKQILPLFIGSTFKMPESILSMMTVFKRKLTSHTIS